MTTDTKQLRELADQYGRVPTDYAQATAKELHQAADTIDAQRKLLERARDAMNNLTCNPLQLELAWEINEHLKGTP